MPLLSRTTYLSGRSRSILFIVLSCAAFSFVHAQTGSDGALDNPKAPLSLTANKVFSDEFDTVPGAAPDGKDATGAIAKWRTSLWFGSGYSRQGGGQGYYADTDTKPGFFASKVPYNAFSVQDGILSITAKHYDGDIPGFKRQHYLTGLLDTMDSFYMDYGYFEIRLKCPEPAGNWSAFFMYPADDYYNRPQAKYTKWEMDFLEIIGSAPSKINTTTHQKADAHAANVADGSAIETGPNGDDFHVYGFDKEPGKVDVYRDGILILTKKTPSRMTTAGFLCLVLDVGFDHSWTGTPDPAQYPQSLLVDYVRCYQTGATTVVGGPFSSVQKGTVRTDQDAPAPGGTPGQ